MFGLVGVLPDADFLFGVHSMYTHSIGAIVVVALCGALIGPQKRIQVSMAVAAAYGSHVLLDWLVRGQRLGRVVLGVEAGAARADGAVQGLRPESLQRTLEIGSYQTAWAMLHRLRSVLVRPGRDRLAGVVEVDEIYIGGEAREARLRP